MSQWGADFMHLGSISFLYVMNKIRRINKFAPDDLKKAFLNLSKLVIRHSLGSGSTWNEGPYLSLIKNRYKIKKTFSVPFVLSYVSNVSKNCVHVVCIR